jgi:hypothetical protein
MNAAVWFGAAVFFTFGVAPVVIGDTLKKLLGEVWPGVIAMMVIERFFVVQYCCSIIALVHQFAEWLYLGKPLHRLTVLVLGTLFVFAIAGGLWLQPRLKTLHQVKYGYGPGATSTAVQRTQAARSFRILHGLSQTLNILSLCGLAIYVWRVTAAPNGPRFVPAAKFRG